MIAHTPDVRFYGELPKSIDVESKYAGWVLAWICCCKYSVDHRTQLEESIHQEDKKLKYVEVRELFQLSSKGDDVTLASRHNFDSKLNKGEVLTVKKLQQYPQTLEQSVKPKKSKKIQALWG
ncbi:hypothetical protein JM16_009539 [Phytophthora kernoviae]|uniref:Uncharacterized protein n=1 Tax=Phytophthora kernoviae TaxID=325452 RepID=A0A8T0LHX2_9STRA|nr:hypothetical protein JM16_009539 [Phytophthora kernoviae]